MLQQNRSFCFTNAPSLRPNQQPQNRRRGPAWLSRWSLSLGLAAATIVGPFGLPAYAENSRQVVTWGPYDRKDPLTGKTNHQVAGQVEYPDGNMVQAYARCHEDLSGDAWPGVIIPIGTFYSDGSKPKAYASHRNETDLPLVVNDQRRTTLHLPNDNPRANFLAIGFYDPAAARRFSHVAAPPLTQFPELGDLGRATQEMAFNRFAEHTGGTIQDLSNATSIGVQLPLFDGTADVIELNPQDPVFKSYVLQCAKSF